MGESGEPPEQDANRRPRETEPVRLQSRYVGLCPVSSFPRGAFVALASLSVACFELRRYAGFPHVNTVFLRFSK